MLLVLLWVALSVPGALWPGGSFRLLSEVFIKIVVMYLLIVGAVRGPRDVERLALAYFVSAAVYAAIVLSRPDVSDSARLVGLYDYDANEFATFIVTALPLGLYFIFGQRQPIRRAVGGAGLAALVTAFVRMASRGGFLALLGVTVFFLVGYGSVRLRWRILGAVLLGMLFALSTNDNFWERMQTILHPEQDYNYTASAGRLQIWRRGIGYMLQRPLFGVGTGNFPAAEGTMSPLAKLQERGIGMKWSAAHNTFVEIGAELGVPGLVFFLGLIITAFGALRNVRRVEASVPALGRGPPRLSHPLMASLVGFVVGAVFLSLAQREMLYTLAALGVALRKVTPAPALATSRGGPVLQPGHR
jgi:O-antigen ligase